MDRQDVAGFHLLSFAAVSNKVISEPNTPSNARMKLECQNGSLLPLNESEGSAKE